MSEEEDVDGSQLDNPLFDAQKFAGVEQSVEGFAEFDPKPAKSTGLRRRLGRSKDAEGDGLDDGSSGGDGLFNGIAASIPDHRKLALVYYGISVGTQLIVYICMWMQWARTIDQSDTGNFDWMYWLLFMGSIVWLTQLSQLSKHIDPEKQTLWEMFEERRNVWVDILGANPVPQLQINAGSYDQKLIDNLTWHARMVFAPMWNMLLSGFLLNFLNITTMEELVSDADKVECTDNILGIITNVKTRDLAVMAIGVLSFTIGAVSQFKLSEVHFQDLTTGYISYFRNTHSVKLLADAVEKATRGAAVFTNMRMRVAYFANVATQCILLYLMSIFSGVDDGGESLDLIGSFIFSVLVFERFLVGFQLALFTSYINRSREFEFSESDRALQSIQQRERVEWHGTMIFYTGIFAVMQSLICLPGLLAVIPFFKEASVESSDGSGFVDCSKLALGLSAKLDRATSEEMANFSSCVGLWLVSMLCQVWLMRTHYVQYWRYQKDVIFTINNEQEDQSQKRRQGAKAQVWEMQRQMMERVTRLRSTGSDGDAAVLQSVLDHFGLAATETMNGLTPLDIRMALSTQLEFVFQTWKMEWEQKQAIAEDTAIQQVSPRSAVDD